jgi:Chaperone of endosialidase
MPLKLNGSTSGYTQIQAAATAGNNTLTLPTSGTNLLADNGSGALTIQTINSGSSNALTLQSNNATALYVNTSQNVGIGTTSPYTKLDVSGAAGVKIYYTGGTDGNSAGSLVLGDGSRSANYVGLYRGTSVSGGAASNALTLGAYDYIGFNVSAAALGSQTEQMRIDSSGNVGIATTSPGSYGKLAVVTATNFPGLYITDGTYSGAITPSSIGGMALVSNGAYPQIFYVNSAERARIDSAGNFMVGTTNSAIAAGAGVKLLAGTDGSMSIVGASSTSANNAYHLYSTGAGAYRFYVGYDGTIHATSAIISSISDQRLKENVTDLDAGLDKILALKPRKFDWKDGKGRNIKGDRGFIAQEFEQVFPDLIDEWLDPAPTGEEPYKSVRQDLIPVLVKAIQEQQALITAQAADIAALKAKVGV